MPKEIVTENPPLHQPSSTKDTPNNTEYPPCEEIGGTEGPEPTRYGDWEKNGRCIDF